MVACEARMRIAPMLSGKKMTKIGRVADLVWISFGEAHEAAHGIETCSNKEYALHIQCTSRIVKNGAIVLGNTDIYCAGEGMDEGECPYAIGKSMFDQRARSFNNLLPLTVIDIEVKENGDIKIMLQDDFLLEVFVVGATPIEYWRAFALNSFDNHIVYAPKDTQR